jgi:hypothetical protein
MADALDKTQGAAEASGQPPLTLDEINDEIRASREAKKRTRSNDRR